VSVAALFYDVAGKASELSRRFGGSEEDIEWCAVLRENVRAKLFGEFWSEEKKTFGDNPVYEGIGTDCEDGFAGATLKDDPEVRQALADGIERQMIRRDYASINGIVTFASMLDLMADHDKANTIYHMFNHEDHPGIKAMMAAMPDGVPEWFYATEPLRRGSISHADYTQMSRWFYYGLGGLRPDAKHPGFRHFELVPQVPDELDHAAIWHQSPYGRIESAWKKGGGKLIWKVTIPPNSTATVHIPAADPGAVTESGKPLARAEGVKFVRMENHSVICELQSGSYRFEAAIE
jgi:alpha-L-rhamnosidase